MSSAVEDSESAERDNALGASVCEQNSAPAILDEQIVNGGAVIQVVRQWLKGSIPGRGKIIQRGLSGFLETEVEEERIRPFHTFFVQEKG